VRGASANDGLEAVHPADREAASGIVEAAFRGDIDTYACEVRVRDRSGDWRWLSIHASVVSRGRSGLPRLIVGTYQDVTTRRRAEEQLRESEERYRLVAEAQFAAVYEWTADDGRIAWSSGLTEVFGYRPEEVPDWPTWFVHVHPDDAEALRASLRKFHAERGIIWRGEYRYRHADGTYRFARERAYAIRNEEGRAVRMVGAIADATAEYVAREAELERRKFESLTVMAAGIAHDFNNLLTAILGNASIARAALGGTSGEAVQALGDIEAAARRAAALVRQMLDFAGAGEPAQGRCDLNAVAQEAAAIVRGTMEGNVRLVLELAAEPVVVRGEEQALSRVVVNLLSNAREALAGARGRVTVRTTVADLSEEQLAAEGWVPAGAARPGRFGIVEVEDTGPGIRAETLGRIFDPFFSTKFAGRGLGLASVLGIVRRHNGGVRVRSTVGVGTCFTVAIPLAEGGPERA
jgi:two-component system, cell cycle sensor histidine kinase and response regulator CckA